MAQVGPNVALPLPVAVKKSQYSNNGNTCEYAKFKNKYIYLWLVQKRQKYVLHAVSYKVSNLKQ
jgi:hypothetical protein